MGRNNFRFATKTNSKLNIDANIISLLHPRTNRKTPFLFVGTKIYAAANRYPMLGEETGYASWFVGDSVISDGSLVIATPIDPSFFSMYSMYNFYTHATI